MEKTEVKDALREVIKEDWMPKEPTEQDIFEKEQLKKSYALSKLADIYADLGGGKYYLSSSEDVLCKGNPLIVEVHTFIGSVLKREL